MLILLTQFEPEVRHSFEGAASDLVYLGQRLILSNLVYLGRDLQGGSAKGVFAGRWTTRDRSVQSRVVDNRNARKILAVAEKQGRHAYPGQTSVVAPVSATVV